MAGKEHGLGYDRSREQVAAGKVGRAMELPSPFPSLIPSLVLNAVVTLGSLSFWLAAIRFRRVPVLRVSGRLLLARSRSMARKRRQNQKANRAVLPVSAPMRPEST